MKKIFFSFIMASSLGLWAQSNAVDFSQDSHVETRIVQNDAAFNIVSSNCPIPKSLKKRHCRKDKCIPGPTGPTGPQGAGGPAGPQGAAGILSRAYGSFFTEEEVLVNAGDPILFTNQTQATTPNLSLVSDTPGTGIGGSILISEPGDYFVTYGLMLTVSTPAAQRLALTLNGILVEGSNMGMSDLLQMATISTIMHVADPNSILRLINALNTSIVIGANVAGDITAFITLEKLHDPQTP